MKTVDADEAEASFLELLEEVEAGETITITRLGVPVAEFRPFGPDPTMTKAKAVERMKHFPKAELPEGMTIKDLIHDGHKY